MIKASELRVGNWLKRESQPEGFLVDAQTISRIYHNGVRDEEPIPLTPEWLERLGFDNNKDHEGYYMSGGWICKNYSEGDGGVHCIAEVRYVHQLQNLYFALTGQELELKEVVQK